MEQTIAKAPETVEESETTSLLAERAAVKSDRQEIKGRMYDLQFDNLSEADSQAAKDKIIQDHKDIEDRYESHVNMVKDEIAKEKAAIVAIKKEYDEKAAAIIKTETNPSKEEATKLKRFTILTSPKKTNLSIRNLMF
jgi:vacuolar-type H+-ATPase subunit I/STV1